MRISGLQKLTLLDFPGKTAATVFLAGCNMRCPFCHNSSLVESASLDGISEEELFSYLRKRQGILDGVCITGGEPTLRRGLYEFLSEIKALGYLVKLDTNGTNPEKLKELLDSGVVDYVAMDIKNTPEKYPETSGTPNLCVDDIKKSVQILKSSNVDHEFRTTLVDGFHTEKDVEEIAKWLGEGEKYFLQKFVDSGDILSPGCKALPDSVSENYLKAARKYVPLAQLRGM